MRRLDACAKDAGASQAELLTWLSELLSSAGGTAGSTSGTAGSIGSFNLGSALIDTNQHPISRQQAALISQLVAMNNRMDQPVRALDDAVSATRHRPQEQGASANEGVTPIAKQVRRSAATSLRDTWFSWFAMEPRIWSAASQVSKQQRSTAKRLVSYPKLFVDDSGLSINAGSSIFCDDVLAIGAGLEARVHDFLQEHGESSRGSSAVLKSLWKLHRAVLPNSAIILFQRLCDACLIFDPAPAHHRQPLPISS